MTERYYTFRITDYPQLGIKKSNVPFFRKPYKLNDDAIEWLNDNTTGDWNFYEDAGRLVFMVSDEALAFKLGYL